MKAFWIAFSMYSRIPMPSFVWEEEDRKKAMCFFPAVGIVIGILFYPAYLLLEWTDLGREVAAALLTALPIVISGGIHMDGYMDTCDALASYGDREKKLEILKDTHTGAFAVLGCVLYFLLYYSACMGLSEKGALITALGFPVSRALSGLLVSLLPKARKKGMLSDFVEGADFKRIVCSMLLCLIAFGGLMTVFAGWQAVFLLLILGAFFFFSMRKFKREFGGITGDLSGYFLCVCELFTVIFAVFLD